MDEVYVPPHSLDIQACVPHSKQARERPRARPS